MSEVARRSIQKIYQLSVFLENRVGLLLQLSKLLEFNDVTICALSIIDTADSAIVRMVVNDPAKAKTALREKGLTAYETPLIGVEVPLERGIGITSVLGILLRAEINIHYVYSLITQHNRHSVLALHVDQPDLAARILSRHDLDIVGQDDLRDIAEPPLY